MKFKQSEFSLNCYSTLFILFLLVSQFSLAQINRAQYGPQHVFYEIPEQLTHIYFVSPDGDAEAAGTSPDKPTNIESAIKKVVTGDAIILRGGTYRTGNLVFNQGITIQPYKNEKPVLKGTFVAENWKKSGKLYVTEWEYLFPGYPESWWRREREEKYTPMHRFNGDMVFIDGEMLQSVGSTDEVDDGTFYIDYDKKLVYIGVKPKNHFIEITAFNKALFRTTDELNGKPSDKIGPTIRGLEITQYVDTVVHIDGFYPDGISKEEDHGNDVVGTTLENIKISYCSRIAFFLIGDSLTVRNCDVSNSSTEGVYIVGSDDVLLENNIFSKNNIEKMTGYYPSAVKIFNQCYRVVCRNNLITDLPNSNGLWYDVGNVDGVFINNYCEYVGTNYIDKKLFGRHRSGFFFEISKNVVVAGNTFVNCDLGSFILNSCNGKIYGNTYINSPANFMRTERSAVGDHFGWHPATGPDIDERIGHEFGNNLLISQEGYLFPHLVVSQTDTLCAELQSPQLDYLDHNTFIRVEVADTNPLIFWRPLANDNCGNSYLAPAEMNKENPEFSANSEYYPGYKGEIFVETEEKDFVVTKEITGKMSANPLPEYIKEILELGGIKNP
ncbi:MAG: right-handed parallel beta-helix repeat-containing protein [Bacteroidales bacterium]|nr:right-handed parallel beta-helix repeat-containing protein [Bacteroidales bacterium]MBN2819842.1 right-handed parallel beta-helix repeat-containing protein [Bacteroidales bacterium]